MVKTKACTAFSIRTGNKARSTCITKPNHCSLSHFVLNGRLHCGSPQLDAGWEQRGHAQAVASTGMVTAAPDLQPYSVTRNGHQASASPARGGGVFQPPRRKPVLLHVRTRGDQHKKRRKKMARQWPRRP